MFVQIKARVWFSLGTDALSMLLNMNSFHNAFCILNYQFSFQAESTVTSLFYLPYVPNFKDFPNICFGPSAILLTTGPNKTGKVMKLQDMSLWSVLSSAPHKPDPERYIWRKTAHTVEALCIFSSSCAETQPWVGSVDKWTLRKAQIALLARYSTLPVG